MASRNQAQDQQRPPAGRAARLAVAGLGLLLLAGLAGATTRPLRQTQEVPAETSALINQLLDSPIDLAIVNRPLPEVLVTIEDKTGVLVTVAEETYALLPYGRETPINVTGQGTLRETLNLIGMRLALEPVLRDENVELRPLPALARTGRRASVQELAGLDILQRTPLNLMEGRPDVARLLEAVDLKLAEIDQAASQRSEPPPGFQVENRLDEGLRERPIFIGRNASLLDALEAIHEQTSATWFAWGDSFIVVPKADWVRRRLQSPVTLLRDAVDVQEAISELQQAARVPFNIEPGALQQVPEQHRRITVELRNSTVAEALGRLGGITGLAYDVSDNGVYIYHTSSASAGHTTRPGAGSGSSLEQAILLVDLGDGMSLLLYPSDLPAELRARLQERRRRAVDQLRQSLDSAAGNPATEPSN